MTPKEKAEELITKYSNQVFTVFDVDRFDNKTVTYKGVLVVESAKQCALIAVDEILNSFYNVFDDFVVESSKVGGYRNMKDYWREVETEILNMKGGEQ